MDIKESIINRLRETRRDGIEQVIDYMQNNGFFVRGCHRHHRYKGGLADHAWQTYQLAMKEEADHKRLHPNAPLLDDDSLAISALLHDFCDCHGMRHAKGHGRRSAMMLKELGFHLTQEEFLAIRFHMSLKGKEKHPLYENALNSRLRLIVHSADGKSAKKHAGFSA